VRYKQKVFDQILKTKQRGCIVIVNRELLDFSQYFYPNYPISLDDVHKKLGEKKGKIVNSAAYLIENAAALSYSANANLN
jgi:hypothetical protein